MDKASQITARQRKNTKGAFGSQGPKCASCGIRLKEITGYESFRVLCWNCQLEFKGLKLKKGNKVEDQEDSNTS